ncbi:hypothetical protein BOX15_Mlig025956g4, partial [Macrostomum lignano]
KAKRFLKPELNCFVFQNPFGILKIALSQFGDMTASNPGCRSILLTLVLLFSCLSGLWSADAADSGELQQQQLCNFGLICEFKNWPNNADNWHLGGYSAQSAWLPSTSVAQLMTESTSESALHIAKSAIGSNCITFRYWLSSAELSISVRQASSGRRLRRMMLWQQRADDGDDNDWQQGQLMLDAEAGDSAELVIAGSALLSGRRSVVRIADLAIRKGGSVGEVADCPTMPPQAPAAVAVPAVVRFGDIGGFDCDFNDNLCGWTNDPDGDFNWERDRLITGNTVITADSTGNKDGKYMFPKPVGPSSGKKCRLLSPTFDGTQVYCLSFFYYINSNFLAGINVYWANGDTLGEPIFSIFEEKDKRWFEARLNLFGDSSRSDRNRIVFEGVGGRLRIVTLAFERTALTRGSCDGDATTPAPGQPDINCDFELGKCNYWNQQLQGWSRSSGQLAIEGTGPQTDHTTGSRNGHFMLFNSSRLSRLFTPRFNSSGGHCLSFWFHAYGRDVGPFRALTYQNASAPSRPPVSATIWELNGPRGNLWLEARSDVTTQGDTFIIFEAESGRGPLNNIAIDDVSLHNGACPFPGDCDFEQSMCEWRSLTRIRQSWVRSSGAAEYDTGPQVDHTTGTADGSYMRLSSRSPAASGDDGVLQSPVLHQTGAACMTFWYTMYGRSVGTLQVSLTVVFSDGKQTTTLAWELSGGRERQWLYGQIPIPEDTTFQVEFRGVIGQPLYGDLAIDDVFFKRGWCTVQPVEADRLPSTGVTSSTALPTTTKTPNINDCNFETGICSWTQAGDDDFDWTRNRGPTPTAGTGPTTDHTTGTADGWYMYIRSSYPTIPNQKARLLSSTVQQTQSGQLCLEWWYHMYGSVTGTLKVGTNVDQSSSSINATLWSRSGDQGDTWRLGRALVEGSGSYRLVIEAGLGARNHLSDIAIDDVAVYNGNCPFTPDSCTFEADDSMCGYYSNPISGNFTWRRQQGPTQTKNTGPSVDRTTQTSNGHYALASAAGIASGLATKLISPLHHPLRSVGCVRFFYHMYGAQMGTLRVRTKVEQNGESDPIFELSGNQGDTWFMGSASLEGLSAGSWVLIFEAEVGSGILSDIALDDVVVSEKPCPELFNCDFEDDLCQWSHSDTEDFRWTRQAGHVGLTAPGPSVDHSTGSVFGHYILAPIGFPLERGNKGWLVSHFFTLANDEVKCISFWYYMSGDEIGRVSLFQRKVDNRASTEPLWTLANDQASDWRSASLTIRPMPDSTDATRYEIVLEAILGAAGRGDIAIDDFSSRESVCAVTPTEADPKVQTTGTTTTPLPTTTFRWEQQNPDIDCNFDSNWCKWRRDSKLYFTWQRARG